MAVKHRWTILVLIALAVVVFLPLAALWPRYRIHQARLAWKESAIPEITRYADDSPWVKREIAMLVNESAKKGNTIISKPWLSDRMMLMKSGEWLVYRSHCHKEEPRNVQDICIAKGSNGKWYYSTCHFCVGMISLLGFQENQEEIQPKDLAWFLKNYQFKEFDGQSNECLKTTKQTPENW